MYTITIQVEPKLDVDATEPVETILLEALEKGLYVLGYGASLRPTSVTIRKNGKE